MNTVSLIGAEILDESAERALNEAVLAAQGLLSAIATDEDFVTKVTLAFGDRFDHAKLEELRQQWASSQFEVLPNVEIRPAAEINRANGAFSADTNSIYLSQKYVAENVSNIQVISNVLLEEIGHFVDAQINVSDAPGDEGEIFAAVVSGVGLNEREIQRLKGEDDRASMTLNGQVIEIEQATDSCPDTTPLNVEVVNGEFQDTDGNGHCDAQGTIYIGRKDGIARLLRIEDAKAEFENKDEKGEDETLKITGTVFSEIGHVTDPLFVGDFEIPLKTAKTSSLTAYTPESPFKIAGLNIDYKSFRIDPDKILLEGGFVFPIVPDGLKLELNFPNSISIDNNGVNVKFLSGLFELPNLQEAKLFDLFKVEASDVAIEYKPIEDIFKMQGKFKLGTPFFKVKDTGASITLDLAGDNYIKIEEGQADVKGSFSIKNLNFTPAFGVSELSINFEIDNGRAKNLGGKAEVKFPWSSTFIPPKKDAFEAGVEVGFGLNPFELDKIKLNVNKLNIPLGSSGVFLQGLLGGVNNLASSKKDPVEFIGKVGLSFGTPESPINLDIDGKVSSEKVAGGAKFELIKKEIYEVTANGEYNWNKEIIKLEGGFKALEGVLQGKQNLTGDFQQRRFSISGDASVKVPKKVPLIGGKNVAGLSFRGLYTDDNTLSNDFVAAWRTFKIPFVGSITAGLKFSFNGSFKIISRAKDIPKTNSFDIQPGAEFLLLAADWDNETEQNVKVRVKDPNGNFIEEADFAANNIAIADELTGSNTKTIIIKNPAPGNWDLKVIDDTGLGEVRISGFRDSVVPTVQVADPVEVASCSEVIIDYEAFDADSDAEIKLFYNADNKDFDGVLIADGLIERDGAGRFVWNTEGIPTGDYFIYAMIADENNPPVFSYSQGKVKISEEADLSVTQTANTDSVGITENLTYTAKVTNNGSVNSKGVTLVQTIPEGATFVSASLTPFKQEKNTLTFDLNDLASGQSTTVDITVAAPTTVGIINSNSSVTSRTFDPDKSNNINFFAAQVDVIQPKLPDLAVTRIAGSNSVNLGNTFTYTLTVTNNGFGDTTGVVLTENLFSGFTFVNATSSQGSSFFDSDKNVVTIKLDNLNHGEQATVNVTVKPIAAGNLVSTTRVTGNEVESNLFNNSIIEQVTVNPVDEVPNQILGTPGRDTLAGTDKDDIIVGSQGADVLTGGGGNDQFVYQDLQDMGDRITDFQPGSDKIVLTQLLNSLGYSSSDPIADGYLKLAIGQSNSTIIQIDPDGPSGNGIFRPFIQVDGVSVSDLNNLNNFVF